MIQPAISQSALCPECQQPVHFHKQPRQHQLVTCSLCGEILEVASLDPIVLDWTYAPDEKQAFYRRASPGATRRCHKRAAGS